MLVSVCMVGVFVGLTGVIGLVNEVVPDPFMDEVFHVGQTAAYCRGRWDEWDPKITTPPGLYYAALAILRPLASLTDYPPHLLCSSTPVLRYLNALYAALLFLLLFLTLRKLAQQTRPAAKLPSDTSTAFASLNILCFPLAFFPSLLFYTDLLSLICVLFAYHLTIQRLTVISALAGALAVFMRQSNIVWVAFCAGVAAYSLILDFLRAHVPTQGPDHKLLRDPKQPHITLAQTARLLGSILQRRPALFAELIGSLFSRLSCFLFVGLGFAVFAVTNGGLALGDRSAHQVVFHLPQLYYFLAFSAFFGLPHLFSSTQDLTQIPTRFARSSFFWLCLALSMTAGIAAFTYDHPYLLSDNRHYTFYIWKNWFRNGAPWSKFVLIPGYLLAAERLAAAVRSQSQAWRLGFVLCLAAASVPNRLLEFRYFLVPFVLWRLHTQQPASTPRLFLEFLLFNLINLASLVLFLYFPFRWTHEPNSLQRFMW